MGDTTMTTYTAEEFARVKFARHLSGRAIGIRRPVVGDSQVWEFEDPIHPTRWRSTDDQGMASMSHEGWIPVVETQQAVRERDAWRKQAYDLREELNRQELPPLTLDGLKAAWEAAEVADECREGDVLIMQDPVEGYSVWRTGDADYLSRSTRILSRAPKREPWVELADIIGRYEGDTDDPAGLARFLLENEVTTPFDHDAGRVTGGDDDE